MDYALYVQIFAACMKMIIFFFSLNHFFHSFKGIIPLIGTTQISRQNSLMLALNVAQNMTTSQWWKIGNTAGLCALADSQCNYGLYK